MALTTVPASLSATALTLTTAAQPNITSVGTLTGLTVSGNIAGTLTTAAQTNITSVGTLTGLNTTGDITVTKNSARVRAIESGGATTQIAAGTATGYVGTYSNDPLQILSNSTAAITIDTSQNVGIGTDSPAQTLHVSSTGATSNGIRISNSEGSFETRVDGGEFYLYDVDDTRIPFLIDSSGRVGMGTTSPSSYYSKNLVVLTDGDGTGGITLVSPATDDAAYICFADGTSGAATYAGYMGYSHNATENMFFGVGGSTKMTIRSDGLVAIGSNHNPTHSLHVLSTDNKAFLLDRNTGNEPANLNEFSSYYSLSIKNRAGGTYLNFGGGSSGTRIQATDGAGSATAKTITLNPYGGNVGIGTNNPSAPLHVDPVPNVTTSFGSPLIKVGGDNSWGGNGSIYSIGLGYVDSSVPTKSPAEIGLLTTDNSGHTKGALVFATRNVDTDTAPSERMRIDSSGKVGIGTASPTEALEVAGNVKLTGSSRLLLPNFWIGPVPNTANNNNGAVLLVDLDYTNPNNVGFQYSGAIIANSYTGQAYLNINIVKHYTTDNVTYDVSGDSVLSTFKTSLQLVTLTYNNRSYLAIKKNGGGTGTIFLNGYFQGWDPSVVTEVANGTYTVTTTHATIN